MWTFTLSDKDVGRPRYQLTVPFPIGWIGGFMQYGGVFCVALAYDRGGLKTTLTRLAQMTSSEPC